MVSVGDRVQIASPKVGREPREGVVTAVVGSLLTVQWDTGEESRFIPGPGSISVVSRKPAKKAAATALLH